MSTDLKAWETWWAGCTLYVAATTRPKARYITAQLAAEAWDKQPSELLTEVQVSRAPQHDAKATQKGEPGSLHPLEQWKVDPRERWTCLKCRAPYLESPHTDEILRSLLESTLSVALCDKCIGDKP
jgi:hypothetical protein